MSSTRKTLLSDSAPNIHEQESAQEQLSTPREHFTVTEVGSKGDEILSTNIEDADIEKKIVSADKTLGVTCDEKQNTNINNNNNNVGIDPVKNLISSEYKEKLACSRDYMKRYQDAGYDTLRERNYADDLMPHAGFASEFSSSDKVTFGEKMGIQLLTKDKKIYMVTNKAMQNATELPTPKLVTNSNKLDIHPMLVRHVFVVVKKKNMEERGFYELRVTADGHDGLVNKAEKAGKSIVCAGEIYTLGDQLVFANDQTGHFYKDLQKFKKEYMTIFEMFFPKDLGYTFFEVPDGKSTDELKVIMANQIIESLLPKHIPIAENIIAKYKHAFAKYETISANEADSYNNNAETVKDSDAPSNNYNSSKKRKAINLSESEATLFALTPGNPEATPATQADVFKDDAIRTKELDL